jgi:hypothetical protein
MKLLLMKLVHGRIEEAKNGAYSDIPVLMKRERQGKAQGKASQIISKKKQVKT